MSGVGDGSDRVPKMVRLIKVKDPRVKADASA
jgi:hypothetical protein